MEDIAAQFEKELLICLHHLTHRHDVHFKPLSVKGCAPAIHPAQFLEFPAEGAVVYFPLLEHQQRISIDREIQVAERLEEDKVVFVFYRTAPRWLAQTARRYTPPRVVCIPCKRQWIHPYSVPEYAGSPLVTNGRWSSCSSCQPFSPLAGKKSVPRS